MEESPQLILGQFVILVPPAFHSPFVVRITWVGVAGSRLCHLEPLSLSSRYEKDLVPVHVP